MIKEIILLTVFAVFLAVALTLVFYPLGLKKLQVALFAPVLVVIIAIAYWQWGAWVTWNSFIGTQAKKQQVQALLKTIKSPEELIEKLKNKVENDSNSPRGWFLLGRLYASQGDWNHAFEAFHKAHSLDKEDVKITLNLAQSIWQKNHQKFTPESRNLLKNIISKDKDQPDALAMLAMDAFMSHDYQIAIDYWEQLLKQAPSNSEEGNMIRKAIARAEQRLAE